MKAMLRFAVFLLCASAIAADWTEYRIGPLRVVSNAGDAEARKQLVEMEQIRWVLAGMLGKDPLRHEELDARWPITLVLFDDAKDRAAYALATPFIEGGSANLSTTPSAAWRSDIVRQLIESNAGRMPQEVETALADLFATIEAKTTRVAIGAPVAGLPPNRQRAWAKLHLLATRPEYTGRLRVYLKNLQGGDASVAAFNTYNIASNELEARMNAYADRGVFHAVDIFGEAITPAKEFYERRVPASEIDVLLAELKSQEPAPNTARAELAKGTREGFYAAAAANPKWGEPHARIAGLLPDARLKIAPLSKAVELEPRRVDFWEALARAQTDAELFIEASKSWVNAERAAGTDAERVRLRQERAAIEQQRVEAELAAARTAKDEAEREVRRIMAESDARIKAAEDAANRNNRLSSAAPTVGFKEVFTGVSVAGRLREVECDEDVLKLIIEVPKTGGSDLIAALVRKSPLEADGKAVFACGVVMPARRIEVMHDGKADVRWNTVGEVETYELK
jgi:hypothetical protein